MAYSEDQIERMVQRKFDSLDHRLMTTSMSQAEYDELAKCINAWANAEYDRAACAAICRRLGLD